MSATIQLNTFQEKNYNKALTGAGVGAIGGATAGYFLAKPWQKDGKLSNKFIKKSFDKIADINLKYGTYSEEEIKKAKCICKFIFKQNQTEKTYLKFCKQNLKALNLEKFTNSELEEFVKLKIKTHGSVDNICKNAIKELEDYLLDIFSNVKKGSVKPLDNANNETIEIRKMIKKSLNKMKRNTALKWGLIGAGALGALGFCIDFITKKNNA